MLNIAALGKQIQTLVTLQKDLQGCDTATMQRFTSSIVTANAPQLAAFATELTSTARSISQATDSVLSQIDQCLNNIVALSGEIKQHAEFNARMAAQLRRKRDCQELVSTLLHYTQPYKHINCNIIKTLLCFLYIGFRIGINGSDPARN